MKHWLLNLCTLCAKWMPSRLIVSEQIPHPLYIYDNFFFRWLCFSGNAIQSKLLKCAPAEICLATYQQIILPLRTLLAPKHILMMGLGGGDLIRYCLKQYPQSRITVVEYSPRVIEIAHDYFSIPKPSLQPQLSIVLQNAYDFILESHTPHPNKPYVDLCIMDIFTKTDSTRELCSEPYLACLTALLSDEGLLILNLIFSDPADVVQIIGILNQYFHHPIVSFQSLSYQNTVLVCFKNPSKLDALIQILPNITHTELGYTVYY